MTTPTPDAGHDAQARNVAAVNRSLQDARSYWRWGNEPLAQHNLTVLAREVERQAAELERMTDERNIAVNAASSKIPGFDVQAMRVACDQRDAANRRCWSAEDELKRIRASLADVWAEGYAAGDPHQRRGNPEDAVNPYTRAGGAR